MAPDGVVDDPVADDAVVDRCRGLTVPTAADRLAEQQVDVAVAVDIADRHRALCAGRQPPRGRIGESTRTVVEEQARTGELTLRVRNRAEDQIKVAVAVEISERDRLGQVGADR